MQLADPRSNHVSKNGGISAFAMAPLGYNSNLKYLHVDNSIPKMMSTMLSRKQVLSLSEDDPQHQTLDFVGMKTNTD